MALIRLRRRGVGALVALSLLAAASPSRADEVSQWNEAFDHGLVSRPHTIAELEVGAIVLPSAPISPAQRGGNLPAGLQIGKGDATVQLGVHVHYRAAPAWSIGAGVLFAPRPTNDTGYGLGGSSGLSRTHSRDYLFVGAEGRYFPLHYKLFEAWVGVQAGGIVVADRFTTDAAGAYSPKIGYPQVNERTEGFAFGGQVGFAYSFAESFTVGFTLRASGWFLPSTPQCSTIGDCATLTSTAAVYEGGLILGYRLPL